MKPSAVIFTLFFSAVLSAAIPGPYQAVEAEKARVHLEPRISSKRTTHEPQYGHAKEDTSALFRFTSTYSIVATADQITDANNTLVPGEEGAVGYFNYGINSHENVICYNITLLGVTGEYKSPAFTATHIHEAAIGTSGPPRIAFANPNGDDIRRNTVGCLKGPFVTGIKANGVDTGEGFHVKQIEENPRGFFTDTHTNNFPTGAVRGQLVRNLDGSQYNW